MSKPFRERNPVIIGAIRRYRKFNQIATADATIRPASAHGTHGRASHPKISSLTKLHPCSSRRPAA